MNKPTKTILLLLLGVLPCLALTTKTGLNLINSVINSTPIGQTTPAAGTFTSLSATTNVDAPGLTLNHAAPNSHTLCGNGTQYVDSATTCVAVQGTAVLPAGRCAGCTVTNTTGHAIFVSGSFITMGSGTGLVVCSVDGNEAFRNSATATVDDGDDGFAFMVPSGSTYVCNASGNVTATVRRWVEITLN